jgi:Trk K+ transport system NAD-binding subunit
LNRELNVVARAVHVDTVNRLHQAGANHVLAEPDMGFQLLQVAMVQLGILPKLKNYVIREVPWDRKPMDIRELTTIHKGKFKIICVVTGDKVVQPALDYVLQKGDRLVIMGAPDNIKDFMEAS